MYLFKMGIIRNTAKMTLPMKKRPQNILIFLKYNF